MTAVFDTNVLLAAIITEGICARLLHRARAGEIRLVSCPFLLKEVQRVLSKKFRLSVGEIASAMEPIREAIAEVIEHNLTVVGACRDSDDDHVLACALAAQADYLITGDSDLLEIREWEGIPIMTPRDFEALFK